MNRQLHIPPLPQIIDEQRPLTNALFEYLPEARRIAVSTYFEPRRLQINETLLGCMVRFEVRRMLASSGIQTEEEIDESEDEAADHQLGLRPSALLGLTGVYKGYHFRILKSLDGTLPPPGRSIQRREFYAQQTPLLGYDESRGARPNVVFLWRFVSESFPELFIAVPKSAKNTRASVHTWHTVERLPHPAQALHRRPQNASTQEPPLTRKVPADTFTSAEETRTTT